MDYREIFITILNAKLFDQGCYLNLPNEEWSCKIMTNLLINHGVDPSVDEKKKDDLIQA